MSLENCFQEQGSSGYDRLMRYWQGWIQTQSESCVDQKCLVVKLSGKVADLSESMCLALLKGSLEVIEQIAVCIEAGVDDGSIVKVDAPPYCEITANLLYNMWLGATLMGKLQRNSHGF